MMRTTFFIPNLHCPTCTAHVNETLNVLLPTPQSISVSIISHTLTVEHDARLTELTVSRALDEAGFEVFDAVSSSTMMGPVDEESIEGSLSSTSGETTVGTKYISSPHVEDDAKRQKHIANCEVCYLQIQDSNSARPRGSISISNDMAKEKDKIVVTTSSELLQPWKTDLLIDGMTCASCVSTVTHAFEGLSWVQSLSVNLLQHSATVVTYGENHVQELIQAVEDAGFEASVQHQAPVRQKTGDRHDIPNKWLGTFAIDGMTCSSCVNSISSALKEITFVDSVEVNLLTNSALLKFGGDGQSHANEIIARIEEIGFDAKLDRLTNLAAGRGSDIRRHVSINVSGMYCEHCPPKIVTALNLLSENIEVDKLASLSDPILKLSYLPDSPRLTIRQIIQAIANSDESFKPIIHKPISIEERSQRMQKREQRHMLYRFVLALAAAVPSLVIGVVYMSLVPSSDGDRIYLEERLHGVSRAEWSLLVIATPVYFFAADVFHLRALKELRALWRLGSPIPIPRRLYRFGSMNLLISLGTSIAYFASVAQVAISASSHRASATGSAGSSSSYFDSVVFLSMFLLLGRLIEAYSRAKTGSAVAKLGKLRPSHAMLVCDHGFEAVSTDMLDVGDVVRVPSGGSPPFDGLVIEGGLLKFDESSLTGESRLVSKDVGDKVFSGTINKGNPTNVRLARVSGDSMLDQIINIVREGQARRAPIERVADTISGYFVPVVTLIAISTWIIWMALGLLGTLPPDYLDSDVGGWPFWSLEFAIAVFVVACPCGIGLASPTALFVGGGVAANHGILVKGGGEAFQEASGLDGVVFDKTGTLTEGSEPRVTDHKVTLAPNAHLLEADMLGAISAIEGQSSHPIASALMSFRKPLGTTSIHVEGVKEMPGRGMQGFAKFSEGASIEMLIGNELLLADNGFTLPTIDEVLLAQWKDEGKSVALVAIKSSMQPWQLAVMFAISDSLRPEAPFVVQSLQKSNIDLWMLSGDNEKTAHAVGKQAGIPPTNIIAGVLPAQKADKIKYLQRTLSRPRSWRPWRKSMLTRDDDTEKPRRAIIAMIGDGINDAPALTSADIGIAIGAGSDVALSSAAFVLVSSDLTSLLTLIHLSRAVFRRIKINFAWALVYNCIALPVAAGVLFPLKSGLGAHVRLDPVWASLAMALSSISVVCSSLLLRSRLPWVGFRVLRRDKHG